MNRKVLVPVAAILLAGLVGLIAFFLMDDGPEPQPHTAPGPATASKPAANDTPERITRPRPVTENIEPDPVSTAKPPRAFVLETDLPRLIVQGRVEDGHGVGIADAQVLFSGQHALRGITGAGYTDAAGNYRLLAWSPSKAARSLSTDRKATVSARTPDGGQGVAEMAEVSAGEAVTMPPIVVASGGRIEGVVLNEQGGPAPGARVTIRSALPVKMPDFRGREPQIVSRPLVRTAHADERGQFSIPRLPAATYRASGDPGYWGMNTSAPTVEVSEGRTTSVEIRLLAENHIRGQVVDSVGQPVPGAVVQLGGGALNAIVPAIGRIERADRTKLSRASDGDSIRRFPDELLGGGTRQMTDSDGRFGFFGLQDHEWTISVRLGQAEARLENQRINQADRTITLATPGNSLVSGTAVDAETGLAVTAFDLRVFAATDRTPDADPFARVAEDRAFPWRPAGAFRVVNPPGGAFRVRITAPGYLPHFVPVSALGQGEHRAGVEAKLMPLCELTLTPMHDSSRLDLEPVMLLFDERLAYQASTDERGTTRIPDVAPGHYHLRVVLANGTVLGAEFDVPAKRRASLSVSLAPAG